MPMLIRTPEDIMRAEPRDLYYIEFMFHGKAATLRGLHMRALSQRIKPGTDPENPPGRQVLLDWFAQNLPEVTIEPLAPSERSGFISGGIEGRIRIDFDDKSLATFTAAWENGKGYSKDRRFQAYRLPYAAAAPYLERPPAEENHD